MGYTDSLLKHGGEGRIYIYVVFFYIWKHHKNLLTLVTIREQPGMARNGWGSSQAMPHVPSRIHTRQMNVLLQK